VQDKGVRYTLSCPEDGSRKFLRTFQKTIIFKSTWINFVQTVQTALVLGSTPYEMWRQAVRYNYIRTWLQRHEGYWSFYIVITEDYNVMFKGEVLTGATECLTLYTRCRINNVAITGLDCIETFRREVPILRIRFTLLSWKYAIISLQIPLYLYQTTRGQSKTVTVFIVTTRWAQITFFIP
jgi:hypothetical protein